MLWPKKNSYKEFDNEKIPLQPPHNFSNGPSLAVTENRLITLITDRPFTFLG